MSRAPNPRQPPAAPRGELALDAPRALVAELAAAPAIAGLALRRGRVARVRRLAFDGDDGELARAGVTLEIDEAEARIAQTLRSCEEPPVAGFSACRASAARLAAPRPDLARVADPALRARARELLGGREPGLRSQRALLRTARRIALGGAAVEATFEIDAAPEAGAPELGRITLAPQAGSPAAPFRVALRLLELHPELRPAREDAARALSRALGAAPRPDPARPIALAPPATLGAWIEAALAECLRHVAHAEAAARIPGEVEGVHQLRVAVRRLRTLLRLVRAELPPERADWLRGALEPLSDASGAVRDLDVFGALLAACEASGAPPLAALREAVAGERASAFATLARLLDSPEKAQLDLELGLLVFGAGWREPARAAELGADAERAARALAARADRRALRAGRGFAELEPAQRHRLRLRVKSARYAVELLAPLLPVRRTRRYVRSARALQDALGLESDAARARSLAERLAPPGAAAGAAFVSGWCAGSLARGSEARDRAWRRFRRARRPWE